MVHARHGMTLIINSDLRNNAALLARGGVFVDAARRLISPKAVKLCVPMAPRTLSTNASNVRKGENNA